MPVNSYYDIVNVIEKRIKDGTYPDKIPSQRQISEEFRCSPRTVVKAVEALKARGLVVAKIGQGVYVKHN